jgi:DNA-binding NtrC family response regulator
MTLKTGSVARVAGRMAESSRRQRADDTMTHRLLVVEDDSGTRIALREIFTRMGWLVSTAGTVSQGLARLDDNPQPCCLILDMDLPDGNGEEVLAKVREMGLKSRVVVATGNMDSARLRTVADLGPDILLTKPVTVDDVWDGICRVCDNGVSHQHTA